MLSRRLGGRLLLRQESDVRSSQAGVRYSALSSDSRMLVVLSGWRASMSEAGQYQTGSAAVTANLVKLILSRLGIAHESDRASEDVETLLWRLTDRLRDLVCAALDCLDRERSTTLRFSGLSIPRLGVPVR
jgi:hypothetical protein